MKPDQIPFNWPYMTGKELNHIVDAYDQGKLAGDGKYTQLCQEWLEGETGSRKVLLTHSCTAALEMAAILVDISDGDEIIMPSYTFVSTANAFVLHGGTPIWVDIREDTLNIDESKIEAAITPRTKAIVAVHYAGVACEMDTIMAIAEKHGICVIEDAAQGVTATYKGRALGSIGHLGCYSFHETKNITSGEGGALLVNDAKFMDRGEIIWEKGTNRKKFFLGQVDKYTWVDVGSSYLPGEIIAAFLYPQLLEATQITDVRLKVWEEYRKGLNHLEKKGRIRLPIVPDECDHNAHMFYILLRDEEDRTKFIHEMEKRSINCVFHYVPLHTSPAGIKFGRTSGSLSVTENVAARLVRLPLWVGIGNKAKRVNREVRLVCLLD